MEVQLVLLTWAGQNVTRLSTGLLFNKNSPCLLNIKGLRVLPSGGQENPQLWVVGTILDPVAKRGSYKPKADTDCRSPCLPHPAHIQQSHGPGGCGPSHRWGHGAKGCHSCRVPSPAAEPRLSHCASLDTKPTHKRKGIYFSNKWQVGVSAPSNLSKMKLRTVKFILVLKKIKLLTLIAPEHLWVPQILT